MAGAVVPQAEAGQDTLQEDDRNLAHLRQLSDMFDYSRLRSSAACSLQRLVLVMYFPLGLLLVPIRMLLMAVMGFLAMFQCTSFCLPRKVHTVLLRIELLVFFGVWIRVKGMPSGSEMSPIWVSNHISEFDAIVIRAISDSYILGYHFYQNIWWLKLSPLRLFKMIYVPQQSRTEGNASGRDEMNRVIRDTLTKPGEILLLFPEGGLTNGRSGLLQYHKFVFSLGLQVQPIAISLSSPLPIHVDTMYASFAHNVLSFMFVPLHIYKVEFLAPTSIDTESEETPLEFSRRIMEVTAKHLNIKASPFLYSDKKKWGKLRRELNKKGYKFNIVIDELENAVCVTNTMKKKKKFKTNQIQPIEHDRDVLLQHLYESWQMKQATFSHLAFAPVITEVSSMQCEDITNQ